MIDDFGQEINIKSLNNSSVELNVDGSNYNKKSTVNDVDLILSKISKNVFLSSELNKCLNVNIESDLINRVKKIVYKSHSIGDVIYDGEFVDDKLIKGRIIYPFLGVTYEGEFVDNYLIKGKKTDAFNNLTYEGEFVRNKLIKGKFTRSSKNLCGGEDVYEGEFENDQLKGQGKVTYRSGVIHEGVFAKNKLINGKITCPGDDGYTKEGEFDGDQLNGKGKKTCPDGTIYEGEFENDQLKGQGKVTYRSGVISEGMFAKNKLINGKITCLDGMIYEGEFECGYFLVKGKKTCPDGTIYEGEFKWGSLVKGKITCLDGMIYEGEFERDQLIKGQSNNRYIIPEFCHPLVWKEILEKLGNVKLEGIEALIYKRKLMFGFSIGQRRSLDFIKKKLSEKIENQSNLLKVANSLTTFNNEESPGVLNEDKLKVLVQGEVPHIHMLYMSHYLKNEIENLKGSENHDLTYISALQNLRKDLERSIPFAIGTYSISRHSSNREADYKKISEYLCETLIKMKQGEKLFIPTLSLNHAMLLVFVKGENNKITPTIYNTGDGLQYHKAISSISIYQSKKGYIKFPTSKIFPSLDIIANKNEFEAMTVKIFKSREEKSVSHIYDALNNTFGKGRANKPKKIQINGVCSFQCLSAALKDVLGRENYNNYKLGLLTQIQDDFKKMIKHTESSVSNEKNKNELFLDQILLEDNELAIASLKIKIKASKAGRLRKGLRKLKNLRHTKIAMLVNRCTNNDA